MILPIVTYGCAVLREKANPVGVIQKELEVLAADMLETMYDAKGLGLAAPQVGVSTRMVVIDVPLDLEKEASREENAAIPMPLVMLNPEILTREGTQRNEEGCLSFPQIGAQITRSNRVTVRYLGLDGKDHTITASGLLARALQHETDHLDGVLLVDKMSSLQKLSVAGQLKRLRQQNDGE